MKKKELQFAECDGKIFVKSKWTGIHQLVYLIDGLRQYTFGKGKTPYMEVKDVVTFWEGERDCEMKASALAGFRKVIGDYEAGKCGIINEELGQ